MNALDLSANWHTHNYRCRHARGDFRDYAAAALGHGISILGVSDHCPIPDNRDSGVRMPFRELQSYIEGFGQARDSTPGVELHLGVELEHYPDLVPQYAVQLLSLGVEYIAGATHFFCLPDGTMVSSWHVLPQDKQPTHALAYGRFVVGMIESGCYAFIAHPDLIGCFCDRWSPECEEAARMIARASRECGVPLEINTSGLAKPQIFDTGLGATRPQYPWPPFWKAVAAERATAIVNSDAHAPELVAQRFDDAIALCDACGIVPRVFRGVSGNRLS